MLEHGGRLRQAARHYGIALENWLDLSTGINPLAYPVADIPLTAWQRLPEEDDGLEDAAARYYGSTALLPVAGSQPAIQALPTVLAGQRISLLAPSYAEHAHAWRHRHPARFGNRLKEVEAAVIHSDIVVVVQPNNPTGGHFGREQLLDWHQHLRQRGGWLIVDEAFIDATPEASVVDHAHQDGLVVLRSLGKFFGLAGARVGFVFAPAAVRQQLNARLGPWAVSGPARWAATRALADTSWQQQTRLRLATDSARLATLLRHCGLGQPQGTALFQWLPHPRAALIHAALARRGILVRLFAAPEPSLRFGLPATTADWLRLEQGLGFALEEIAS